MTDVAAAAGVSHQTVSRVLNGSELVRDNTRARVLAAIAELGYRRNNAARLLVTNRSHRIERSVSVARGDSNWNTPAVRPWRSSSYTLGSSNGRSGAIVRWPRARSCWVSCSQHDPSCQAPWSRQKVVIAAATP